MPLHLLGKKSWNVYNPANIARVKADEAAAAAREAAVDERRQEIDAARRAALLRGETPPPLPEEEDPSRDDGRSRGEGREPKRKKLRGEDDTDMDIRLAASVRGVGDGPAKTMQLRRPDSDAPLTDHAGNINLFPVDDDAIAKREKNEDREKEKRRKERALEDQYTMRFSNAAGRGGLVEQPWYSSNSADNKALDMATKDVWGNEDPRRKDREQARITSSDPFAFMQQAQAQLKRAKQDKKKWNEERERELRELKSAQDSESQRHKRRRRNEDERSHQPKEARDGDKKSRRHKHRHRSRSRSPSRERRHRHENREQRTSSHRPHHGSSGRRRD